MTFDTRIAIDECKARLASSIDAERLGFSWSGYAGSKPILGQLHDSNFRLQKRRYYRNSFAPFFFGRFVTVEGGTRIEGEFRMHPLVKVFMSVWYGFLGLMFVVMLITVIAGRADVQRGALAGLVIPLGMAAFGFALIKFSRWLGRNEETAIIAFLKSTFEVDRTAYSALCPTRLRWASTPRFLCPRPHRGLCGLLRSPLRQTRSRCCASNSTAKILEPLALTATFIWEGSPPPAASTPARPRPHPACGSQRHRPPGQALHRSPC